MLGIICVGNHGLEIENLDDRHKKILSSARTREIKRITRNLQNSLREIPGILFEEKGPILAVHYRNVAQKFFARIPQILEEELQQWRDRWKISSGKMVLEIRPKVHFHKGKASHRRLHRRDHRSTRLRRNWIHCQLCGRGCLPYPSTQ